MNLICSVKRTPQINLRPKGVKNAHESFRLVKSDYGLELIFEAHSRGPDNYKIYHADIISSWKSNQ